MVAKYGIRLEHGRRRWSGGVASSRRRRHGRHRRAFRAIVERVAVEPCTLVSYFNAITYDCLSFVRGGTTAAIRPFDHSITFASYYPLP